MTSVCIRYEPNKDVNFVHIINLLLSQKIMALDQSIDLYKRFKLAEDLMLDIPDGLVVDFKRELESLGCASE